MAALTPLLREDGYDVYRTPGTHDFGIDFVAERVASEAHQSQTLGVDFKYYRTGRIVGIEQVRQALGAIISHSFDRGMLLANTRFTKEAREAVSRLLPIKLELVDPDSLLAWTDRFKVEDAGVGAEVRSILQAVSRKFATMIAENPSALDELEWRDIERTIAEVFEGLGFSVTLTPSSKDGGKDVVLECKVGGQRANYLVEIKHWRSENKVGAAALRSFLNVIVKEPSDGGLFLSTYGYCSNAFEQLFEVERQRLRFGDKEEGGRALQNLCEGKLRHLVAA